MDETSEKYAQAAGYWQRMYEEEKAKVQELNARTEELKDAVGALGISLESYISGTEPDGPDKEEGIKKLKKKVQNWCR